MTSAVPELSACITTRLTFLFDFQISQQLLEPFLRIDYNNIYYKYILKRGII